MKKRNFLWLNVARLVLVGLLATAAVLGLMQFWPTQGSSPRLTKRIAWKEAGVHYQRSFRMPFRKEPVRTYYLVAKDITAVEVEYQDYMRIETGDDFTSSDWFSVLGSHQQPFR